nr:decapping and exoribonuclease protein-like isoform X1 [Procambarus clarkii]XP_045621700.1 decapping and exoribonuclease protein-like isoform X1 [Procambarus clarkii]
MASFKRKRNEGENLILPNDRQENCSNSIKQGKQEPRQNSIIGHFEVHPRNKYNFAAAVLRRPMFIGDFCLDEKRKFCQDKRNLHFISVNWKESKKVEYDLNVSLDKVTRKDFEETQHEKLDRLLEWILHNSFKFHTKESTGKSLKCLSTDFICFRGLMTELLCTPYEREGWIVCATKFCNTIYLCAYDTPEKHTRRENETDVQKQMSSWGYKFEQYMTDGSNLSGGVNENEEYCCVVRSRLDNHSLVYGAEVDGADPSQYKTPHADLRAFIELKTSKEIIADKDYRNLYRYKFMKWWSQSSLVGIPRVVCGFRDAKGTVHTLETYNVEDMPFRGQDYWKPNIMLNFLKKFLDFVKYSVHEDNPKAVYKFERESNGGNITCTYLGFDPEWTFLPAWFYEKVFRDDQKVKTVTGSEHN